MPANTKTPGAYLKNFLRGVGSVINLQPDTRRNRPAGKMTFTRTVFINGRKIELGNKRDLFQETIDAYASDWKKIAGGVNKVIDGLPEKTRAHASRRNADAR